MSNVDLRQVPKHPLYNLRVSKSVHETNPGLASMSNVQDRTVPREQEDTLNRTFKSVQNPNY